jgi:hypothetical protein
MNINLSELPPLPIILVIAGIIFLILSVTQSIAGRIKVSPQRQTVSLVIGIVLLVFGVALSFSNNPSSKLIPTETPIITLIPTQETSTPESNPTFVSLATTNSVVDTSTSIAFNQNTFQDGCIDKTFWSLIQDNSAPANNNCWDLQNQGIVAIQGKGLTINVLASQAATFYGIVTKISTLTDIKFDIQIDKLSTISDWNTNVAIGLLPNIASAPNLDGVSILFQAEKPNSPVWMMLQFPNHSNEIYLPPPRINLGQIYNVRLEILGKQVITYLNDEKIDDRNLGNNYSFLWIGYTVPEGGALSTTISNFSIDKK